MTNRGGLVTGADAVAALKAAAEARGISVAKFVEPLSSSPTSWLQDLQHAAAPREVTLARVRALLAGEPIPGRQKYERTGTYEGRTGSRGVVRAPTLAARLGAVPVDREPCFKCGVRGDIGCAHRPASGALT